MMDRTSIRGKLVALSLVAAGCRNPFAPSADIELVQITHESSGRNEIPVLRTPPPRNEAFFYGGAAQAVFVSKNKVGAQITRVTIVYTDLAGNLVTSYRTTGGRTYRVNTRIGPRVDRSTLGFGKGATTGMAIYVLDASVYDELESQVGNTRAVIAHLTLRGEDDEGNDLSFSGDITIKGYNF